MLTEIYCDAFEKSNQRVRFFPGLNIVQGLAGSSEPESGNSIGKSTMLKIIDYSFGGNYYSQSNDDIIRHIGAHDICFTHTFDGKQYYFKRNAQVAKVVQVCDDASYVASREISLQDFCGWLLGMYNLEHLYSSFRSIVGLYSRIWNKPNKEVNRPLFLHNNQTVEDAILSLIKLFGKYEPINDLMIKNKSLQKQEVAFSRATSANIIVVPTKKK